MASAPGSTDRDRAGAERKGDPGRVVALSDGVIAIVLTIMVLELEVPELGAGQSLREALDDVRPTLSAFVISFLLVGMYWVSHRDVFALVRRVNRDIVWLNLLFLLVVSMIPWATAVLGRYDRDPVALHLYGAVLLAVVLVRGALYLYLVRHPQLLWEPIDIRRRRVSLVLLLFPGVVYFVAMLLADALPVVSLVLYAILPLLYFLAVTLLRDRRTGEDAGQDFS